jgi:hypothetical protein
MPKVRFLTGALTRRTDTDGKQPGAAHAPQIRNTLTQPTYRPPGGFRQTYGHPSRSDYALNFLDEERLDTRPAKKRRVANEPTDAISVYDEEDVQEISPERRTPRSTSRRSAGSASRSFSGAKDSRSEFERASAVSNPRRKKARTSTSNAQAQPSTILIVDDDVPDYSANSKKLQFRTFQQGVEGVRDKASRQNAQETTSKYFAPRMNHSTLPSGALTQRPVKKSTNYRDNFSRHPSSDSSVVGPWPLRWARAHDFPESSGGLFVISRALNEYCITSSDRNDDVQYKIAFKDVLRAHSDRETRIRLIGSTDTATNVQYMVDLEFEHEQHLIAFKQRLANSITATAVIIKEK